MKKIMIKTKHISIFIIASFMITGSILQQHSLNNRAQKNTIHFYKNDINGVLKKQHGSVGGIYITVGNKEYNYSSKADNFLFIAKKGDSLIKPAFSDTIILKKRAGKIYKFTFNKPK